MDWMIIACIMIGMLPMTFVTGYFIGDPIWRCKILNRVGRGFYGVVILSGWGNNAMLLTKNLKKDLLAIGDDIYAIQDDMIINLKKPTADKLKMFIKHPEAMFMKQEGLEINVIPEKDIRSIGGIPFVELDKNHMIPVEKSVMKLDQKYRDMLPGKVGATLKTEVAVARAKAYNEQGEQMKKILLLCALLSVVAIGLSIFIYYNQGNQGALIQTIYNQTGMIQSTLNSMNVTG